MDLCNRGFWRLVAANDIRRPHAAIRSRQRIRINLKERTRLNSDRAIAIVSFVAGAVSPMALIEGH